MNLKQLIVGLLHKNTTSSEAANSSTSSTVFHPGQNSPDVFFIAIFIVALFIAFLFGFLFWGCIVMWKKRNRQRLQYNDFELDPVVACIANSHHLEQSMSRNEETIHPPANQQSTTNSFIPIRTSSRDKKQTNFYRSS